MRCAFRAEGGGFGMSAVSVVRALGRRICFVSVASVVMVGGPGFVRRNFEIVVLRVRGGR